MTESSQATPPVTVLHVEEELDLATTPALRASVAEALGSRPQTLALDLSRCPFAGVDALEALATLTERARRQGTTLVLIGLQPVVRRAIGLIGLESQLLYGRLPHPRPAAGTG